MDKVIFKDVENLDGTTSTFAIIDRGNGEFTSMPKDVYDKQQAEQSTPIVIDEAEAK